MEKKIRKISLLCTTAVMACSLVLGAGITALPKTVSAETASMTSVIGKKTDNITVTAGVTKGDHLGLQIGSQLMKEDWSAQIDATFTGSTSISYLLPNMANNEDVKLPTDSKVIYGRQGNAFSVRKTNGDLVATFVTVPKAWGSIGNQSGYMYNAIANTYTAPYHHWDGTNKVDYWADPVPYRTLDPVTQGAYGANYVTQSLSAMCIAPSMGVTTVAEGKLDSGNAEGTLYFDYADGVLTISSSSYDLTGEKLATQRGNGQIIPFGSVEVDLSDGYTIEAHNAPDFGKDGDVNYWDFTCSSSVLLTTITTEEGAFDTLADEVELTASDATISYVGEKVVEDKNVISVAYGEKLNDFELYQSATATNETSQTIVLNGYKGAFAYADNKAFTANEDIVVSNGTVSKNYTVEVVMPTLATANLVKGTTGTVSMTAEYTAGSVTGLLVNPADKSADWSADINGTFTGNSSITYALPVMANSEHVIDSVWTHQANAFSVKNSNGDIVATFITAPKSWGSIGGQSAYFYNGVTNTYTMPYHSWKNSKDCWNDPMTYYTLSTTDSTKKGAAFINSLSTMKISPSTGVTTDKDSLLVSGSAVTGTVYFDYADGVLTVKTSSYDFASATVDAQTGNGQVLVMGTVNVDLSAGYTVMMHNAPDFGQEGDANYYDHTYSSSVLITAIGGVDTTGETTEATSLTKEVVCENGAEVAMGEELTFKSNSVYNFGSLTYKGSDEVTVDVAADVSKPGATVAVVSDWAGTYEIPFTVKTLSASFTGVEMVNGGFIRMGTAADGSDKGIGFKMNVSAADKALIDAYVGEGKAYASASYGMIIMPYSYVGDYGDVNAETLFGDSAVYTWEDKEESVGSVAVVQMETANLKANGDAGYIFGALTELKASTVTTDLIGVGYVKLVDANGEVEYVVVSAYSDTSDDAKNNIRTAFEVAKAVYEDPEITNEDHKKWLYDNYLKPNGYEVA